MGCRHADVCLSKTSSISTSFGDGVALTFWDLVEIMFSANGLHEVLLFRWLSCGYIARIIGDRKRG